MFVSSLEIHVEQEQGSMVSENDTLPVVMFRNPFTEKTTMLRKTPHWSLPHRLNVGAH